jgi:hypothetical protein
MQPSRRILSTANPVAGILLVLAVVAACGAVGAAVPSPSTPAGPVPTAPSSPAPSDDPVVEPSPVPSEAPSGAIDLDTADDHAVSVVIEDEGGLLGGSASGRAGDGMSVRWGDVEIVNVDEDTLRVTWVGLPVDAEIRLVVAGDADAVSLAFTQPAPPADSDAIGFDRVLVLDFVAPVQAADVEATFATAA